MIGHEAGDAIAKTDALGLQRGRHRTDLVVQFGVADLVGDADLAAEQQSDAIVLEAQQVLGEVQPHVREPARAGHALAIHQHGLAVAAGFQPAEIPDQRPEFFRLAYRELIQIIVVRQRRVRILLAGEAQEAAQIRTLHAVVAGFPDRLVHKFCGFLLPTRAARSILGQSRQFCVQIKAPLRTPAPA